MKKRIITIVGARPQFIKSAVLSNLFKQCANVEEIIIHTGQHYDAMMSEIFFKELQIPAPSYLLKIPGGQHGKTTGEMMIAIEEILLLNKPDAVLVYGDTNSTLAGALAASKIHIPVLHVEAGLRSFNKTMPEEINRILTDHISSLLFCPTRTATSNLALEGITVGVYHVGDIMYDAMLFAANVIKNNAQIKNRFKYIRENDFALLTVHRANTSDSVVNTRKLLDYAVDFSKKYNLKIVFPVHPRIKKIIEQIYSKYCKDIILIEPISYFEIQFLLTRAKYVLTDSGGLQKEAYFHRVPCVTLRAETEWVETVQCGWNRLWVTENYYERVEIHDYGNGDAANKILNIIVNKL